MKVMIGAFVVGMAVGLGLTLAAQALWWWWNKPWRDVKERWRGGDLQETIDALVPRRAYRFQPGDRKED